jgi:hypothetical protein
LGVSIAMASARELAIEVLPHFAKNVIARHVHSYGVYAKAIGRDPAKESMVIGQAMHAIGAVCVLAAIPVAPLYFIKRADGEWRGVFESDSSEREHVLPHYDLLYVTAREFKYSDSDFGRVEKGLREVLPKYLRPDQLSPHDVWHWAIRTKLKDGATPFERALARYREIFAIAKAAKGGS